MSKILVSTTALSDLHDKLGRAGTVLTAIDMASQADGIDFGHSDALRILADDAAGRVRDVQLLLMAILDHARCEVAS